MSMAKFSAVAHLYILQTFSVLCSPRISRHLRLEAYSQIFLSHRKALIIANNTPGQKTLQNEPSLGNEALVRSVKRLMKRILCACVYSLSKFI